MFQETIFIRLPLKTAQFLPSTYNLIPKPIPYLGCWLKIQTMKFYIGLLLLLNHLSRLGILKQQNLFSYIISTDQERQPSCLGCSGSSCLSMKLLARVDVFGNLTMDGQFVPWWNKLCYLEQETSVPAWFLAKRHHSLSTGPHCLVAGFPKISDVR